MISWADWLALSSYHAAARSECSARDPGIIQPREQHQSTTNLQHNLPVARTKIKVQQQEEDDKKARKRNFIIKWTANIIYLQSKSRNDMTTKAPLLVAAAKLIIQIRQRIIIRLPRRAAADAAEVAMRRTRNKHADKVREGFQSDARTTTTTIGEANENSSPNKCNTRAEDSP